LDSPKTPEETEKVWGDQVLEDMVRVIRSFRPNIVINGWAAYIRDTGIIRRRDADAESRTTRADTSAFPDQLKEGLPAWGDTANKVLF